MANYELWLTDARGVRISDRRGNSVLARAKRFNASRTVNRIGSFSMILPADIPTSLIRDDNMVQIWRGSDFTNVGLWRPYFIRKREYFFEDGYEVVEISGPDCMDILRRRNVISRPGTSVSDKVEVIDDMMKEIVYEAFHDGVNPSPDYGTREVGYLSIERDLHDGPSAQLKFPWEKLLTDGGGGLLPKLADIAKAAGARVFFDVVPVSVVPGGISFEFRTYTGQPGQDLTNKVLFAIALGNIQDPHKIEDSTGEENYLYGYGQGEEVDQKVVQVYDRDRVNQSVWGRIEGVVDASSQDDDQVESATRAELAARASKVTFYGTPVSTEHTTFGRDWDYGDKVLARYHGDFEAIVASVTLSVEGETEEIDARLEGEA